MEVFVSKAYERSQMEVRTRLQRTPHAYSVKNANHYNSPNRSLLVVIQFCNCSYGPADSTCNNNGLIVAGEGDENTSQS